MQEVFELEEGWHMVGRKERPHCATNRLMEYLGKQRGVEYELLAEPDKSDRSKPAADYVYTESGSGKLVAIEYTEWTDPQEAEAEAVLTKGKRLRQGVKANVRPLEMEKEQVGFVSPARVFPDDFAQLDHFIVSKIKRGQLRNMKADERILLIYDAIFASARAFRRYHSKISASDQGGVDHAFIIVEQRQVFQIW